MSAAPRQPGEWLEHSPLLTILLVAARAGWLFYEFSRQSTMIAISSLNTYNFLFIMLGLLLHWRPKRFLNSVVKAVPATAGVLIQFPLYGAITMILTAARNDAGLRVGSTRHAFATRPPRTNSRSSSASIRRCWDFSIPSGGGKWLLEAPM